MADRVVYVTGGTKGAGHLVRGVALGRALRRAGVGGSFSIITPIAAPAAMAAAVDEFSPTVCSIDSREVLDRERALGSELAAALRRAKPDLLIVDLFWAPLVHIRPTLECEAWLIVRSCPPIWLVGNADVDVVYDGSQYQRVIGIEPVEHPEIREHIEPMVICNPDENRSREAFCERFGVPEDDEIVVISHGGLPGEIGALKATPEAVGVSVVRCDLHAAGAVFPLAPWLANVDAIHCSAGYNSYWEARWLGFSSRTTFSVFRRQIDDPLWRVKVNREHQMRANGADVLARMITQG